MGRSPPSPSLFLFAPFSFPLRSRHRHRFDASTIRKKRKTTERIRDPISCNRSINREEICYEIQPVGRIGKDFFFPNSFERKGIVEFFWTQLDLEISAILSNLLSNRSSSTLTLRILVHDSIREERGEGDQPCDKILKWRPSLKSRNCKWANSSFPFLFFLKSTRVKKIGPTMILGKKHCCRCSKKMQQGNSLINVSQFHDTIACIERNFTQRRTTTTTTTIGKVAKGQSFPFSLVKFKLKLRGKEEFF